MRHGSMTYSLGSRFVIEICLQPVRGSLEEVFRKIMSQVMIQNPQLRRGAVETMNGQCCCNEWPASITVGGTGTGFAAEDQNRSGSDESQ